MPVNIFFKKIENSIRTYKRVTYPSQDYQRTFPQENNIKIETWKMAERPPSKAFLPLLPD